MSDLKLTILAALSYLMVQTREKNAPPPEIRAASVLLVQLVLDLFQVMPAAYERLADEQLSKAAAAEAMMQPQPLSEDDISSALSVKASTEKPVELRSDGVVDENGLYDCSVPTALDDVDEVAILDLTLELIQKKLPAMYQEIVKKEPDLQKIRDEYSAFRADAGLMVTVLTGTIDEDLVFGSNR